MMMIKAVGQPSAVFKKLYRAGSRACAAATPPVHQVPELPRHGGDDHDQLLPRRGEDTTGAGGQEEDDTVSGQGLPA